ncbi:MULTISPECIES: BRO family protein [unclassified Streptomyces]|uniref:BRO family protein n=1 Tax=unclassified Streptomyces TaxID=2593676 RepID=UPI0037FF777C
MPFTFPDTGQAVRTVTIDGEPWWITNDVCAVLGITNIGNVVSRLDTADAGSIRIADGTPGNPNRAIVNESGLYDLILDSRKPEARLFRRWITSEVIPQIRRTGRYEPLEPLGDPLLALEEQVARTAQAIEIAKSERARADAAESRAADLEPSAGAWDTLASAAGDYSVREAAHILNRDPLIDTGERRLFAVLRGMGMVDRRDRPYQRHARHVRLRPRSYTNPATRVEMAAAPQIRVTTEGLAYLHRRLGGGVNVHRLIAEDQLALPV